ncbi:MAG: tyrosine-type recombinase/integrase [Nanoarchaeota archaeon]
MEDDKIKIKFPLSKFLGVLKRNKSVTLRHSFATHLIGRGYDVSQVQVLLGDKSPETTMIYVHMTSPNKVNVKSPIESIY